uniref:Outer-membrane lipoprotein carrier protein n=1 Tax=Anthurium amnicola TaxID=1678845 RepID=A0A1D1XRB5_9ARAE
MNLLHGPGLRSMPWAEEHVALPQMAPILYIIPVNNKNMTPLKESNDRLHAISFHQFASGCIILVVASNVILSNDAILAIGWKLYLIWNARQTLFNVQFQFGFGLRICRCFSRV